MSATSPEPFCHLARTNDPPQAGEADVCPMCKGAGYYVMDVPAGDPNFGVLITCSCKVAEKERRAHEKLLRLCNMDAFADKTFETFDRTIQGVERAYQRAVHFAREPRGWLIFFGNYGCGKTHLAAAIANQLIQRDCRLFFSNVPDLLDHLRSTFGPSSEVEYDERFETIRNSPVLILDDLGTENTTPWAREKLYQLINHRYNNRLATVITSNYKPHDIDERIFSRMSDVALCGEITMIDAADYRKYPLEQRRLMGRRKTGFSVASAGAGTSRGEKRP